MKRFALLAILALSICLSAGAHAQGTIKPGDLVSVTVLGEPDLSKKFTVDQIESGKIQVTVLGEVKTPGILTLSAGSKLIDAITAAGGYTPNADLGKVSVSESASGANARTIDLSKFLLGGDVSVNVPINSGDTVYIPTKTTNIFGNVTVLGAVRQSGSQPITQGMTVREVIMLAGGPTEFADTSSVTIRHEGSTENVTVDYAKASAGDPMANVPVRPGDTIYVASRQMMGYYTIQGGVAAPGRYELRSPTSITEAIAIAGGIRGKANLNDVSVLRGTGAVTEAAKIKIKVADIMVGNLANVMVQNGDSIIVPTAAEKKNPLQYAFIALSIAYLLLRR